MIQGPISDPQHRAQAIRILNAGGVVAVPTETVYGLAARLDSVAGIEKIFTAKGRPKNDPLIVHVASLEQAFELCHKLPTELITMLEQLWPGPLTLVLPKQKHVSDLVTSGQATVAIRMPQHAQLLKLINELGSPLVAPSANRFGRISPTRSEHVVAELADRIDMLLEGEPCAIGIESTILLANLEQKNFKILRPGGANLEQVMNLSNWPIINLAQSAQPLTTPTKISPGLFNSHYAPQFPLLYGMELLPFFTAALQKQINGDTGYAFLAWDENQEQQWQQYCQQQQIAKPLISQVISAHNTYPDMANQFYHVLRGVDEHLASLSGAAKILLAPLPVLEARSENYWYAGLQDRVLKSSSLRWDSTNKTFINKTSPDYFE